MNLFTINIQGKLYDYTHPAVMGIINITPDSFYSASSAIDEEKIARRVSKMLQDGADMIDIGGYSTRPGASEVSEEEEMRRIAIGMRIIRSLSESIPVSVDTFRASVARKAITEMSADIINDISGGNIDPDMYDTVASLHVPYILTHSRGAIDTMHSATEYEDFLSDVLRDIAEKVSKLQLLGVNDIIIDPGFGFSKTTDQNFSLLRNLEMFECFHKPLLVGFSRKSMITKTLGVTPEEALNGTTVLNTIAIAKGAAILRVHDVKAAKETVALTGKIY